MRCAVPIKNRQNQRFNALCAAAEKDKINVECTVCSKGRKKDFIKKIEEIKSKMFGFRRVGLGIQDCAIIFTEKKTTIIFIYLANIRGFLHLIHTRK